MKGGNAMIDIPGNINNSIQNVVSGTQNTLGGYSGNELYKGLTLSKLNSNKYKNIY